ncbi:PaaI family thioesterase [Microbacterium aurum]
MVEPLNAESAESPAPQDAGGEEVERRREAATDLGRAMRALSDAVVLTELDTDALRDAARAIEDIAVALSARHRSIRQISALDDMATGIRYFSPVTGLGHPASPPFACSLRSDGALVARGRLGARFEGPPSLVHGGMIALVFDEILGWAATRVHAHGMTATLEVSYRRGVPLEEDVVVVAHITRQEGRKVWAEATLARAAEEDRILATARALFVRPRDELRHEYFDALTDASGQRVLDSDEWEAPTA